MFLGVTASSRGLVVATWAGGGHIPLPGGGSGGRTGAPCQKRTPERQQAGAASFQALALGTAPFNTQADSRRPSYPLLFFNPFP